METYVKSASFYGPSFEAQAVTPAWPTAKPATPAAPEANTPPSCPLTESLHGLPQRFGISVRVEVIGWMHCSLQLQEAERDSAGACRPPWGPSHESSMQGRGRFPHEPQTKQLGGREAAVKAQQTGPCPTAEKGRGGETDPGLGAGRVLVKGKVGSFLPQEAALS